MGRDEMSNLYREPSKDLPYQVSVHLADGFQRRRSKCEQLTENRTRTPRDGKSSLCLWQGELKIHKLSRKIYGITIHILANVLILIVLVTSFDGHVMKIVNVLRIQS